MQDAQPSPARSERRLPSLDGLRAVAILLVVIDHSAGVETGFPAAWKPLVDYLPSGRWGVGLFFYISGFIITYLLLKEEEKTGKIDLKKFYIRRALRILPVYWIYLLVLLVTNAVPATGTNAEHDLAALTFTTDDWPIPGHGQWLLGHFWSLAVEEQFYLLWPPLLVLLPRHLRVKLLLVVVLGLPIFRRLWERTHGLPPLIPLASWAELLGFGCLAAFWLSSWKAFLDRRPKWILYLAEVLLLAYIAWEQAALRHNWIGTGLYFFSFAHSVAIALLLGLVVIQPKLLFSRLLNWAPLVWIGVLSYSIYIWQQLFTQPGADPHGPFWTHFPGNGPAILLVSAASYYLLEKPILRLKGKYSPIARPARQSPPATPG